MTNHCSDCGAELIEGSKFCSACGKSIEQLPETPKETQPQKKDTEKKPSTFFFAKLKSNKKLVFGFSLVIIAILIIVVLIMFLGDTGSFSGADNRIVGEWEQNTIQGPSLWRFKSDSTLEIFTFSESMTNAGNWKVNTTQLCLYNNTICYTYSFSNSDNILTLNRVNTNDSYSSSIILTKKNQPGTNQTPTIECTSDAATNRITIQFIDPNVKWRDIAISTNPSANWQVQDVNKNALAKIDTTTTMTAYVTTGDTILVFGANGDITITLRYIPTNAFLGNWTINV